MRSVLIVILLVLVGRNYALHSEGHDLPVLFHLDDHHRCLLQPGGLYCLGEFDLAPAGTSRMYENIKKYASLIPLAFNRSRLYRGYCVSLRCPTGTEKNASLRFEECVNKHARRYTLSARLRKLHYCITQQQHAAKAQQQPDEAQQLFLQVVYALLAINVVGTVYDIATGDDSKKNNLLTAWSVRASWRRLTASYDYGDPRLAQLEAIQGMRVGAMLLSIYAHICVQHYQFFVTNPSFLGTLFDRVDGILLSNGTSLMQMFVVISSFLTAYNILLYAENNRVSFLMLPIMVFKRIIRIAPVHLLVVGFAATYFPTMNFAALSYIVEENSASCRRKFWSHVFFLNNVVEKQDNNCLMPSWFLPVDMHLFILSTTLSIIMCRRRNQALRLYAVFFFISALASGLVSYLMGYRSIIYESTPEKIRGLFRNSESFGGFYTSTWGSLPACFVGLFLAHLHYELQQTKYDWNRNQICKRIHRWILLLGTVASLVMGMTFRQYRQPWITAVFFTIDRPILACAQLFFIIGCINIDGGQRRFFAWRGWRVPARLSLPMMLCHWLVSVAISARPVAYHTSVFDVSIDYLATIFYSYAISVPVALLVEIPVQRFFAQFF